jgi:hypothetical protein
MEPMPDGIAQFSEPGQRGFLDDGFVKRHLASRLNTHPVTMSGFLSG